jgi:crotonobetainyl-CoA:carnitine CoA-transferase CaiB-like acyl-CoA transferase
MYRGVEMKQVAGCRVLELGGYVAGPFATLLLANLGAEVIKVESVTGDPSRLGPNFHSNNAGKRSVAADLVSAEGKATWESLVVGADVVVQNLDSAATRRLGVTFDDVSALNPDIVYVNIRGFGPGPYEDLSATNPIVEALCGLMSVTIRDGKPTRQSSPFYDQLAGVLAALGAATALALPDRSNGRGLVEIDLFETGLYSVASRIVTYEIDGLVSPDVWNAAPYDSYPTSDGWVFLGAINDGLWRRFCEVFGLTEALEDPMWATSRQRYADRLSVDEFVRRVLGTLTTAEAVSKLRDSGVPCAPVHTFEDVLRDPQVRWDGNLVESAYSGQRALLPRFPVRGTIARAPVRGDAPRLGELDARAVGRFEGDESNDDA